MNILNKRISFFVIDYTFGGGVERVTSDLMSVFIKNNATINQLVSLYAQNEKAFVSYDNGLKINVLNPASKKDIYYIFLHYFEKERPDIFIFQGDNMTISIAILKAAKKTGVIAIPQYHGSVYAYLKKYSNAEQAIFFKKIWANIIEPFKKRKVQKFIKLSENGLVCVSKGSAEELKLLFSKKIAAKIQTIYNPIFLDLQSYSVQKEKRISFVSRLEKKHKNAFLIVKTWKEISQKYQDWSLHIFGEGQLENKMKEYCRKNNIKNVVFRGFVSNIYQELNKSTITVSTSNCEGFSMAIAEAICAKNAIASTESVGGVKDMLVHYKTALLSQKNNSKHLSKNIETLINNTELRETLIKNSIQNMKKIVSINIFEQWKSLIEKISND